MAHELGTRVAIAQEVLRRGGGLAQLQRFLEAGLTRNDVGRLRHLGVLVRARIGWYVDPAAPREAVRAVRTGGVLGCVSAAVTYGIVVPDGLDGRTHVSLTPTTTRMRKADDRTQHVHAGEDPSVRLHWERRIEPVRGWRVSPADALLQMAHCASVRWLTAAIDCARNATYSPATISPRSLQVLRTALPSHQVAAVDRSDPLAEAAGETFIRLEADDRHIPWRSQAWLTSRYRADGLADEWLPVESDGITRHSASANLTRR